MAVYLVPLDKGRPIILDKAVVFVGRHPECDLVLKASRKVSRKHCCLAQVDNRIVIRDLGSMNGVRVNGRRVRKEATIRVGDELTIGDVVYRLRSRRSMLQELQPDDGHNAPPLEERIEKHSKKPGKGKSAKGKGSDSKRIKPTDKAGDRVVFKEPLIHEQQDSALDLSQDFPVPIPDGDNADRPSDSFAPPASDAESDSIESDNDSR